MMTNYSTNYTTNHQRRRDRIDSKLSSYTKTTHQHYVQTIIKLDLKQVKAKVSQFKFTSSSRLSRWSKKTGITG